MQIIDFLLKFDLSTLKMNGVINTSRNLLNSKSVYPLLELMRKEGIDLLESTNNWYLKSNFDYYNPEAMGPKSGNLKDYETKRLGIVFDGQNRILNPYYKDYARIQRKQNFTREEINIIDSGAGFSQKEVDIIQFLKQIGFEKLQRSGIINTRRDLLNSNSVIPLINLLTKKDLSSLTGPDGWYLKSNYEYYNPKAKGEKWGNLRLSKNTRLGIVFDGQNKFLNPYYKDFIEPETVIQQSKFQMIDDKEMIMKSGRSITDREEHYRKQNTDPEVKNTIIGNSGYYGLDFDNLPDGIIIDNRFEIKQKLGQGGFGSVYKVWDRNLDILKALKVISREFYNDDEVIYDLKHEAKILIKLKHENILYFYDIHFEGDCKYLDMEYIDGDNLVRIKLSYPGKKITEEKALELIRQICQGMIYIHDHNIIHKDLKPHNIMIDSHGTVKIMDFGISETFRTSMSRIKETSKSGTPAYMSPEQLIGEDVGKESDIWSFGIMLYELLSGKQVFTGESRNDVLMQIERRKEYKPIESISDKLNTLLEKCLRYDYKDRFGSFKELLDFMDSTESEPLKSTLTEKPAPATSTDRIIMKPSKSILTDNMVFVEGGEFEMGDTFGDGEDYEKPVHKVFVDSFLIGKYPVTKKEYEEIMGKVRYLIQGEDHPVDVSWYNAVEFCNKLSIREGLTPCYNGSGYKIKCDFNANGYRLPTEAEWEYAARGGNKSRGYKYSGSSDLDAVGWYNDNSENKTHPIGQKEPNELGIYDMSGNVSEWCWDLGDDDYYKDSPAKNPQGSTTGSRRVARGGCWFRIPAYCRVSSRIGVYPDYSRADLGFRLLRSSPR